MIDYLKLDNQLCFALYTANRKMTSQYKPLLDPLKLTYPQYLVMLVLLEEDGITVKSLGEKLYLDSGTLTPLLKRMEKTGYVVRKRSDEDERKVLIHLSEEGKALESSLEQVPLNLCIDVDIEKLVGLRESLNELIETLSCQASK
ncbi:MarR family transcriptional regulator [Acidaminobacter sp. JC074]|uniref:MarR family winged helix-turn-helix transcriptional regulator n=1 Tax=Acidaminobacter sp. JC074 TaxID=2530199 RepID=UPI001F0D6F64|nr:MarR family transcriptional regulator [Acidaminobacter sp. JC074]MCH4887632.1 MarR family transcriptional regulator [Acidaminobacter sp. JC074]